MMAPHVEHGGVFLILNRRGRRDFVDGAPPRSGICSGAAATSSSSRPLTPAWNCASGDRNLLAIHRKM